MNKREDSSKKTGGDVAPTARSACVKPRIFGVNIVQGAQKRGVFDPSAALEAAFLAFATAYIAYFCAICCIFDGNIAIFSLKITQEKC